MENVFHLSGGGGVYRVAVIREGAGGAAPPRGGGISEGGLGKLVGARGGPTEGRGVRCGGRSLCNEEKLVNNIIIMWTVSLVDGITIYFFTLE